MEQIIQKLMPLIGADCGHGITALRDGLSGNLPRVDQILAAASTSNGADAHEFTDPASRRSWSLTSYTRSPSL